MSTDAASLVTKVRLSRMVARGRDTPMEEAKKAELLPREAGAATAGGLPPLLARVGST